MPAALIFFVSLLHSAGSLTRQRIPSAAATGASVLPIGRPAVPAGLPGMLAQAVAYPFLLSSRSWARAARW